MEPALENGDLAFGRGPLRLCQGDVVLVRLDGVGLSIKRLGPGIDGSFTLIGDSPQSMPSVDMGHVTQAQVIAVLRWRVRRGFPARIPAAFRRI
ncbi:MAG: hypothetical protein ACI9IV_001818 [Paracoccaceae bacterium]|jgi:hypothetical protein